MSIKFPLFLLFSSIFAFFFTLFLLSQFTFGFWYVQFQFPNIRIPRTQPGAMFLYRISCKLRHVKLVIPSLLLEQFFMISDFHDSSMIHNNDLVRIPDC